MTYIGLFILLLLLIEAVQLLRLAAQVNSYRDYWQQNNAQSKGEADYVALGDSAAQGVGARKAKSGYVGLLADSIAEKSGKTVNIRNISVSGAKVKDVTDKQLSQLEALKLDSKTFITLDIGSNDMRSFEPEKFQAEIGELFSKLPKQTIVADVAYFGGGRFRKYEKNVQAANVILHKVAEKHNLKVAPLYETTKTRDSWATYAADFFHPSDIGYRNWRDAFLQVLP